MSTARLAGTWNVSGCGNVDNLAGLSPGPIPTSSSSHASIASVHCPRVRLGATWYAPSFSLSRHRVWDTRQSPIWIKPLDDSS